MGLGICSGAYVARPDLQLLFRLRLGELFNQMPKQQGGDRRSENFKLPAAGKFETNEPLPEQPKPKLEVAAEMGCGGIAV